MMPIGTGPHISGTDYTTNKDISSTRFEAGLMCIALAHLKSSKANALSLLLL